MGSVLAWPCRIDDDHPIPAGWHLCDGSLLAADGDDDPLALAIGDTYALANVATPRGKIRLPDFRGFFLRGHGEAGAAARASAPLGQQQVDATRLPNAPFRTNVAGEHSHNSTDLHSTSARGDGGATGFNGWFHGNAPSRFLKPAGAHDHAIIGGDSETRPVNYSVHWIIRVR